MKATDRDERLVREVVERAKKKGFLSWLDLDEVLKIKRGYDKRRDLLLKELGDLPFLPDEEDDSNSKAPRPRIPALGDDDNLRRYLRQVTSHPKMDKEQEIRLGRRLEFAKIRFQTSIFEASIREDRLREVLGSEFSRTYAQDLDLPSEGRARSVGQTRQRNIRARASELNQIRAHFVERNLALVVDISLCYRTYGVPVMDLVQEGNGALIRAVEKFEWRKDVRFQTYATFWVRQAVERSIAFNKGIVRVPNYLQQKMRRLRREGILPRRDRDVSVREVSEAFAVKPEVAGHLLQTERTHFSLDVAIDEDGETFASLLPDESENYDTFRMEFTMLKDRLSEVLGTLSDLEREILELRFGLKGQPPLTLEEVGRRMNVSRERIRQLQVRAIRKLQRPGLIQRLVGFV